MTVGFVPASRLYDVTNETVLEHPANQATDEDVQLAIANAEGGGV